MPRCQCNLGPVHIRTGEGVDRLDLLLHLTFLRSVLLFDLQHLAIHVQARKVAGLVSQNVLLADHFVCHAPYLCERCERMHQLLL